MHEALGQPGGVERRLQQVRDGSWAVPGLWRPDEVRDRVGADVPDDGAYETVGGFVMAALGRIPRPGDEVAVDGFRVRVERMDGRRVDRVRLATVPAPPALPLAPPVPGGVPGTTLPVTAPPGVVRTARPGVPAGSREDRS